MLCWHFAVDGPQTTAGLQASFMLVCIL